MTGYDFWLTLVCGVVLGMLFSMALRWIGRKLSPRIRERREAMPTEEGQKIERKVD